MARKVAKKDKRYVAQLVTGDRAPCAFCHREVDDEITYGKLYAIGDIQCHYFCVLLSCCLVQKGSDDTGLFGFLYKDILAELERSKKHKCSFCGRGGASLGCAVASCRKQFHLPCGRERDAVSMYYGTYNSFCHIHAPKQKIPEHIMSKVRLRMKNTKIKDTRSADLPQNDLEEATLCVICYEAVDASPTVNTFWPVCCARDAWFHRSCLQRMALSAGMHYLKCPLCNDKPQFYDAVVGQGYYVPDRDAAWELEQNAFAEIYERPLKCAAEVCHCPLGRNHDVDQGMWDIKLCLLCGSIGAHASCIGASETTRYICLTCTPAAPDDIQALADTIEKLIVQEQANNVTRRGPVMPSRMSLRRTKSRVDILNSPSTSRASTTNTERETAPRSDIQESRNELNLKTPKKPSIHDISYKHMFDGKQQSPMKLLEERFKEKVICMGVKNAVLDEKVVDVLRRKFRRPRPMCEKRKLVENILDGVFDKLDSNKQKEPIREYHSPRKCYNIIQESQESQENEIKSTNIDNENQRTPNKVTTDSNEIGTIDNEENMKKQNNGTQIDCDRLNIKNKNNIEIPNDVIENHNNDISRGNVAFGTPKLKKIDIQPDSSLAISEQDQSVNIDVIKMHTPKKAKKYAAKRGMLDKIGINKLEIDMESFENEYLNEVDISRNKKNKDMNSATGSYVDKQTKTLKSARRKRNMSEGLLLTFNAAKKRKTSESDLNSICCGKNTNISNDLVSDICKEKIRTRNAIISKRDSEVTNTNISNDLVSDICKEKIRTRNAIISKRDSEVTNTDINNDLVSEICKGKIRTRNAIISKRDSEVTNTDINNDLVSEICKEKIRTRNAIISKRDSEVTNTDINNDLVSEICKEKIRTRYAVVSKRDYEVTDEEVVDFVETLPTVNESIEVLDDNRSDIERTKLKRGGIKRNVKTQKGKRLNHSKLDNTDRNVKRRLNKEKLDRLLKSRKESKLKRNSKQKDSNKPEKGLKALESKNRKVKMKDVVVKREKRNQSDKETNVRDDNIEVTIASSKRKNKRTKNKTKLSIKNIRKDMAVKIKWKREQFQLKIKCKKDKAPTELNKEKDHSKFKQYVLQYFSEVSPKQVIAKPEKEVSPLKRKYTKQLLKSPDNFKQMSIQNFFKVKSNEV